MPGADPDRRRSHPQAWVAKAGDGMSGGQRGWGPGLACGRQAAVLARCANVRPTAPQVAGTRRRARSLWPSSRYWRTRPRFGKACAICAEARPEERIDTLRDRHDFHRRCASRRRPRGTEAARRPRSVRGCEDPARGPPGSPVCPEDRGRGEPPALKRRKLVGRHAVALANASSACLRRWRIRSTNLLVTPSR